LLIKKKIFFYLENILKLPVLETFYAKILNEEKIEIPKKIYNNNMYKEEIEKMEIVGNGSHDARNILAMKKRLEFPELNAIDT